MYARIRPGDEFACHLPLPYRFGVFVSQKSGKSIFSSLIVNFLLAEISKNTALRQSFFLAGCSLSRLNEKQEESVLENIDLRE